MCFPYFYFLFLVSEAENRKRVAMWHFCGAPKKDSLNFLKGDNIIIRLIYRFHLGVLLKEKKVWL